MVFKRLLRHIVGDLLLLLPHHSEEYVEREYGQTQTVHSDAKDRVKDAVRLENRVRISFRHIL